MEIFENLSIRMPPKIDEVKTYFNQRGISDEEAEEFFLFYETKNWTSKKGNLFKGWKNIAYQWIAGITNSQPELVNRQIH